MRATPRGLAIVAWANVVIGALDGWRVLPALAMLGAHGATVRLAPFAIQALLQVVAGLGLLEGFAWASHYLLWASVAQIWLAWPWFCGIASPWHPPSILGLSAIVVAAITIAYLGRAEHRERQPPLPLALRVAVKAVVVLLVIGMRQAAGPVVSPVAAPPGGAQAGSPPPVRVRPRFSSLPIREGTGSATLVPTYDGEPIGEFAAADLRLTLTTIEEKPWIRDGVVRSTQVLTTGTIERPWRVHHGRIRISAVPAGLYRVQIGIDRRAAYDGDARDVLSGGARVEMRTGHGSFREVLPLMRGMTLRAPQTGPDPHIPSGYRSLAAAGPGLGEAYDRLPRIPSHVAFEWDPVPRAVQYSVTLMCDDMDLPIMTGVRSLSWATDLPECQPPHPWRVQVDAHGRDGSFLASTATRAFVLSGTSESRSARGLRPATFTLRPTFDGRPFRSLAASDVLVALIPFRGPLEPLYPTVRVRHGRIKIPGFRSQAASMTMMIGPDARSRAICRPQAGDFSGMDNTLIETVHTDWKPESRTFALRQMMRSVEPEDAPTCVAPLVRVQSPVELRWEPVPEAVEYTLEVTRSAEWRSEAQKIVVHEPVWRGELASTGAGNPYSVKIAARSATGADVATLQHALAVE